MKLFKTVGSVCKFSDHDGQIYPSVVTLIDNAVNKYSTKTAFHYKQHSMSYAEFSDQSRSFAAYMQNELGIRKGHRVAIMLPNCLAFPVALFSILRIGAIQVALNPLYTYEELKQRLLDAGAHTLLINERIASQFSTSLGKLPIQYIITSTTSDCTKEQRTYLNGSLPYTDWQQAVALGAELQLSTVELQANAVAFIQYSDVSGGSLLGAALTHSSVISNITQLSIELKRALRSGREVILTGSPLHHRQSLTVNLLCYLAAGAENIFIATPFDTSQIYDTISEHGVTVLTGNDSLFNQLLSNPKIVTQEFRSLRLCISNSFSSLPATSKRWYCATRHTIKYSFGHAETGLLFCCAPDAVSCAYIKHLRTLSNTDIQIRNEQGLAVMDGEIGELCCHGPQVMSSYWRQPNKTDSSFTLDGYFRTGDFGFIDEHGSLSLIGRNDGVMQVQGEYVYRSEVEAIIMLLPQVSRCSSSEIMESDNNLYIVAYIETKKQQSLSTQEVYSHCKRYLNKRKLPQSIFLVDQLPKPNVPPDFTREALNRHSYFDYTNGVNHDS